jgi:hypothetical protein
LRANFIIQLEFGVAPSNPELKQMRLGAVEVAVQALFRISRDFPLAPLSVRAVLSCSPWPRNSIQLVAHVIYDQAGRFGYQWRGLLTDASRWLSS